ncbi:hypothetical protein MAH1_28680 [Sessilibacter sp. MAH1]
MKVAVASKDGISINLHFGHAKNFIIYDITDGQLQQIDNREVDHYCHGQHGDQSAMQKILHTIKDCQAVFVAKVGDGPAEKLANIGVTAVDNYAYEAVEESLIDYWQKQ